MNFLNRFMSVNFLLHKSKGISQTREAQSLLDKDTHFTFSNKEIEVVYFSNQTLSKISSVSPAHRKYDQIKSMVTALRCFQTIKNYGDQLSLQDWISLGMCAKIQEFSPQQMVCKKGELAKVVFFILQGEMIVSFESDIGKIKKQRQGQKQIMFHTGQSIGEEGVLYGHTR